MRISDRASEMVATGFGAGYLPVAPGTWGSLEVIALAAGIGWLAPDFYRPFLWALAIIATAAGLVAASAVVRTSGDKDPSRVVVDEIAGQALALLFVPFSGLSLLIAFTTFRAFDIVKPFPARQSEGLPGGWGVMADDLVAGIYSGLTSYVVLSYLGPSAAQAMI